MAIPDRPLTAADAHLLHDAFIGRYEEIYGKGTAWTGSTVVLLEYSVTAIVKQTTPGFPAWTTGSVSPVARTNRVVFNPEGRMRTTMPLYDDVDIGVGSRILGPALIDGMDTTILVPNEVLAERDRFGNLILSALEASAAR
jgi:N-methylhydantoinase A